MNALRINRSKYAAGSQWRRWDLHIHTPESRLGSSFNGVSWSTYIDELERLSDAQKISVIGITDYMTIDGYEKIYQEISKKENSRLRNIDLIIPNIEFRVLPHTRDKKAINIHLLIDPTSGNHISEIKRALRDLKVNYGPKDNNRSFGCSRDELIRYGRVLEPGDIDDERAYTLGIEQFKPHFDTLFDWIFSDAWLKNNCLIGIANGKDGISGLPCDGFSAMRDTLLHQANFIFSSSPTDRMYYLGKSEKADKEQIIKMYGSLKPCLHGSDAHDLQSLFKPEGDRFCWIKADPTFEGLRQILWEPESRVHIGSTSPQRHDIQAIRQVRFEKNSWFNNTDIELNQGLVTIIGEKGAGKTALAELLAFASGVSADMKSQSSFVAKGKQYLSGLKVNVDWVTGQSSYGTLIDAPFQCTKQLVRYLSQDFVERLCSNDHKGNELQEAIEEVIFSHLDDLEKEDFSSFKELRASLEKLSQSKQDNARGSISSTNRELARIIERIKEKNGKVALAKQLTEEIERLKKQLPILTKSVNQQVLDDIKIVQDKRNKLSATLTACLKKYRELSTFLQAYKSFKNDVVQQLNKIISSSNISGQFKNKLFPVWDSSVEADINIEITEILSKIDEIKGEEQSATSENIHSEENIDRNKDTLHSIDGVIEILQGFLDKDELNRKNIIQLQKQISSLEQKIKKITDEISYIENNSGKELESCASSRDTAYLQYFQILNEDIERLHKLYSPLQQHLADFDMGMKFELMAGYKIDLQTWLDKLNSFIDGRRTHSAEKKQQIIEFVSGTLEKAWKSGNIVEIKTAISEFTRLINPIEFMQNCASSSLSLLEIYDWIYSIDHISTSYKIKYDGTYLEHLSPGTRGIALLVLYLLMDVDDKRPLIIDQPEGNLDNSSIYLQLVPYIRKAKETRQIILITHNPNLVVATDAEQIIITTSNRQDSQLHPRITYLSGSLEHNECADSKIGIRQAVCELLEGGDRAFKEREGRYSIVYDSI